LVRSHFVGQKSLCWPEVTLHSQTLATAHLMASQFQITVASSPPSFPPNQSPAPKSTTLHISSRITKHVSQLSLQATAGPSLSCCPYQKDKRAKPETLLKFRHSYRPHTNKQTVSHLPHNCPSDNICTRSYVSLPPDSNATVQWTTLP